MTWGRMMARGTAAKKGDNGDPRDFDSAFKELTLDSDVLPFALLGRTVGAGERLPTEFPHRPKRADYCARLPDRSILHVEFETASDPKIALRMAGYRILLRLKVDASVPIHQFILRVGDSRPSRRAAKIADGPLSYECKIARLCSWDPGSSMTTSLRCFAVAISGRRSVKSTSGSVRCQPGRGKPPSTGCAWRPRCVRNRSS